MNPNADKIPVPDMNPAKAAAQGSEVSVHFDAPEGTPSIQMPTLAPSQVAAQAASSSVPFPQPNPTITASGMRATAVTPVAEAGEEIEKKWVNIARSIVERTGNDPHLRSQELSKAGREYRKVIGHGTGLDKE